jgi:CheY-like chemotaxis protein
MTENTDRDILLAEDDMDDVTIFEVALKELKIPYALRHAKDGEVLFELLRQQIPYILFLDINMPCKDGVSCIIELRKHREYDRMPVIVYTAHQNKEIVEDCYREGANQYLVKSASFRELKDKIGKVFSRDWTNYLPFPPLDQFVS